MSGVVISCINEVSVFKSSSNKDDGACDKLRNKIAKGLVDHLRGQPSQHHPLLRLLHQLSSALHLTQLSLRLPAWQAEQLCFLSLSPH